ncbi:MAG: plastocyanin/azurin family copper-binding protein [bacterium]|nr:plastocyanin/azurin family copper-binding protein [bacterium]
MKKLLISIAVLVIGGAIFLFTRDQGAPVTKEIGGETITFDAPKKSAHYESNTPAHASILAAAPINIVIDFNFDLADNSSISITKDGKDYGVEKTMVDSNRLAMRRKMDPASPGGLYLADYKACWPDGSCHNGYFQFLIKRSEASEALDVRNKKEVNIILSEVKFQPQNILVSRGTKIIWQNDDSVEHYVNTDSHPTHTYYLQQNSKLLEKGDIFSLTFDTPGIYPYHCSAHAAVMAGSIIVE